MAQQNQAVTKMKYHDHICNDIEDGTPVTSDEQTLFLKLLAT